MNESYNYNRNDLNWFYKTFALNCRIKDSKNIVEWIKEGNIRLPSNTAEPGVYSLNRTPYQEGMIKVCTPSDPTQEIIFCTGSQIGKTTIEQTVMTYYISEEPSPMGFVFSDDGNLKTFIKFKFDPFLAANPTIKELLKSGGRSQADSLTSKQFPGGFLKFISGKSESSMRSDSMRVVLLDELDGMGVTKGGDVRALMRKRTNTFGSSRKIIMSSTPLNEGTIYHYLEESTFNKYFIKCPECGEHFTLDLDYFRWSLEEDLDAIVKEAWFECPNCHRKIYNEEKLMLLDPSSGAEWKPTNLKADPLVQGFYLPSFYAPVGWISWKEIAQEYVSAKYAKGGVNFDKLTTFYNTILALPYKHGSMILDWQDTYERSKKSEYRRGQIPEWVEFVTTGGDVQMNRLEISLYGWGKNGKHIEFDYYVIAIPPEEGLDVVNGQTWETYKERVLEAIFVRDDGLKMNSIANALDSSYQPDNIYTFYQGLPPALQERFFPIKGSDRKSDTDYMPTKKFVKAGAYRGGAVYWSVPASSLKYKIFEHLKPSMLPSQPFYSEFPQGYDEEHFMQLFSEEVITEKGKPIWKKTRDRNEVLDCTVYNYAMFYLKGFNSFLSEDWDELHKLSKQTLEIQQGTYTPKAKRRILSHGLEED